VVRISIWQIALTLYVGVLVSGCASNETYRKFPKVCNEEFNYQQAQNESNNQDSDAKCESFSLQEYQDKASQTEFMLGFVEIDDQGQLRDRRQMMRLIDYLSKSAKTESALINVYVHGWHHNAEPNDDNVEGFKRVLAELSKTQSDAKTNKEKRKVVGIYVGWRGESIEIPLVNYLTFWDRKNTAQEVGELGVTELLLRLEQVTHDRNESLPIGGKKSRLVIIGHSFGGAIVYSATAQLLLSRLLESQHAHAQKGKTCSNSSHAEPQGHSINYASHSDGVGDLVVLLNPAFEALRYAPAFDMAQEGCKGGLAPRLAILTSETDYANKLVFPLGRTFGTVFETHGEVKRNECIYPKTLDEGEADRHTVGNYEPLISHRLTPLDNHKANLVISKAVNKIVWSDQIHGGNIQFGNTLLTHLQKSNPRSPFLNIQVDKGLMNGHNDILNPKITEFIALLIHLSTDLNDEELKQAQCPLQ
jgi:hypothetical protein